jgi:hypothetical protein
MPAADKLPERCGNVQIGRDFELIGWNYDLIDGSSIPVSAAQDHDDSLSPSADTK